MSVSMLHANRLVMWEQNWVRTGFNTRTSGDPELFSLQSSFVNLSYTFSRRAANDYFFWYRQYPGKPPDFLISHSGTGAPMSTPLPGFSFNVSHDKTQMDLLISSAAVTDSAVYYCAVRPTVTGNTRTLYKNL
uniref:Immunoglobulin V-set domain-containing protein n=1 Tax=Xiphophorus couchianus TaxID=32473 RepID=A0A3B5KXQ0_9TELE